MLRIAFRSVVVAVRRRVGDRGCIGDGGGGVGDHRVDVGHAPAHDGALVRVAIRPLGGCHHGGVDGGGEAHGGHGLRGVAAIVAAVAVIVASVSVVVAAISAVVVAAVAAVVVTAVSCRVHAVARGRPHGYGVDGGGEAHRDGGVVARGWGGQGGGQGRQHDNLHAQTLINKNKGTSLFSKFEYIFLPRYCISYGGICNVMEHTKEQAKELVDQRRVSWQPIVRALRPAQSTTPAANKHGLVSELQFANLLKNS